MAAHHRADLVAVDIGVADPDPLDNRLDPVINPAVKAKGQAKAGGVHRVDHRVNLSRAKGDDVKDGAEHFPLQRGNRGQTDHGGADEMAARRGFQLFDQAAFGAGLFDMDGDAGGTFAINHRADVGGKRPGVAHRQFIHRARQHLQHRGGDILLQEQAAQGRAALPGRLERRGQNIAHRLFGQGGAVNQHGVEAAGFGDQRRTGSKVAGHRGPYQPGGVGGAGKGHASHAWVSGQGGTGRPIAGQELQRGGGNPGLMQQANGKGGDQRGLFGGFGQHAIASRQSGGDLAGKDGEREVPRADTGHDATGGVAQGCAFGGVIAQEINGFAQFIHAVSLGLARLSRQQREDRAKVRLIQISGAVQGGGAVGHRCLPSLSGGKGHFDIGGGGVMDIPDNVAGIGGVGDRDGRLRRGWAGQQRRGGEAGGVVRGAGRRDQGKVGLMGQIKTPGVLAAREQVRPAFQAGVLRGGQQCFDQGERVGGHLFGRHIFINDLIDEGRIRTVFQKAADQIGQKIAMRPNRGIDPAARTLGMHNFMQPLAHAVQALEFKGRCVFGQIKDRGHRMGIVGGKLRIDAVGHAQQFRRIGDIGHVGRGFAGEDRETVQPQHLRPLDLGIPIGPLDQPHHDPPIQPRGQRVKPVKHRPGAAPVSLHHHAKAVPARQRRVRQRGLDHRQRQRQAVSLFGIDVEAQPRRPRQRRQRLDARHQFGQHPFALRHLIARVQRREFDRNAGVFANVGAGAGCGDGGDRAGIGQVIAPRVAFGPCRLAQHVIAVAIALGFQHFRPVHGGGDGFAQHELPPHFLHRAGDGTPDHRLAQPFQRGLQMADHARFAVIQHLAGQHQGPGRGIDQTGGRAAKVATPVRRGNLVLNQRIHGFGVGHPQQRFGKAHQRNALIGRQAIFGKENLHQPRPGRSADGTHQIRPARRDAGAGRGVKGGFGDQAGQNLPLIVQGKVVNAVDGRCCGHVKAPCSRQGIAGCRRALHLYFDRVQAKGPNMAGDRVQMDGHDRAILHQLQIDGRMSVADLARRIGLSKSPVQARVKRLEAEGVILSYRAQLDWVRMGRAHVAFVEVRLADTREAALQAFNRAVQALPEVEQCQMIAGGVDYLLKVRTSDIASDRAFMGEGLSALPHGMATSTHGALAAVTDGG